MSHGSSPPQASLYLLKEEPLGRLGSPQGILVQRKLLRCQEGTTAMFHLTLWVALPFSFSLLQCPAVLSAMPLGILLGRVVSSRLFPMASPPSSLDHSGSFHPCLFFPLSYVLAGLCVYRHTCGVHVCWCQGLSSCHVCTGSPRRASQSSPELADAAFPGQLLWRSSSTSEAGIAGGCHTHLVLLHFSHLWDKSCNHSPASCFFLVCWPMFQP